MLSHERLMIAMVTRRATSVLRLRFRCSIKDELSTYNDGHIVAFGTRDSMPSTYALAYRLSLSLSILSVGVSVDFSTFNDHES